MKGESREIKGHKRTGGGRTFLFSVTWEILDVGMEDGRWP